MAVLNGDSETYQSSIRSVNTNSFRVFEPPTMGGTHEYPSPVYDLFRLVRADVGKELVDSLSASHQEI
jgi:hypothetical protein